MVSTGMVNMPTDDDTMSVFQKCPLEMQTEYEGGGAMRPQKNTMFSSRMNPLTGIHCMVCAAQNVPSQHSELSCSKQLVTDLTVDNIFSLQVGVGPTVSNWRASLFLASFPASLHLPLKEEV